MTTLADRRSALAATLPLSAAAQQAALSTCPASLVANPYVLGQDVADALWGVFDERWHTRELWRGQRPSDDVLAQVLAGPSGPAHVNVVGQFDVPAELVHVVNDVSDQLGGISHAELQNILVARGLREPDSAATEAVAAVRDGGDRLERLLSKVSVGRHPVREDLLTAGLVLHPQAVADLTDVQVQGLRHFGPAVGEALSRALQLCGRDLAAPTAGGGDDGRSGDLAGLASRCGLPQAPLAAVRNAAVSTRVLLAQGAPRPCEHAWPGQLRRPHPAAPPPMRHVLRLPVAELAHRDDLGRAVVAATLVDAGDDTFAWWSALLHASGALGDDAPLGRVVELARNLS